MWLRWRRFQSGIIVALAVGSGGIIIYGVVLPGVHYIAEYPVQAVAPLMTQVAALPTPAVSTPIGSLVPEIQGPGTAEKDRLSLEKDLLQLQTSSQIQIWTAIVQAVGALGLAGAISGLFSWLNTRASGKRLEFDRMVQADIQITNRFLRAIEQLGAVLPDGLPRLEARLGGIYLLERIAIDSPRDQWTIMEVFAAYIRQNAPTLVEPSPIDQKGGRVNPRMDVQAILTVIGRRRHDEWRFEPASIDLRATDLSGADLRDAYLERVDLTESSLASAVLSGADLHEATLTHANLRGADLAGARLTHARLRQANLADANLAQANLERSDLHNAVLRGANLERAVLLNANLEGAIGLKPEQLARADLVDTSRMSN